jgi:hypothetical protein
LCAYKNWLNCQISNRGGRGAGNRGKGLICAGCWQILTGTGSAFQASGENWMMTRFVFSRLLIRSFFINDSLFSVLIISLQHPISEIDAITLLLSALP